jgi:hypothetical protein
MSRKNGPTQFSQDAELGAKCISQMPAQAGLPRLARGADARW